ncbi:MAG: methyltransferase domain-containing protein [Solirubrobacteraceae bacterium]
MPSLDQNLCVWGETYDWSQQGEEWSDAWGGVSHQWWTTLFPRIQGYVPAGRILEIAPGYGRWTHFLRDLCDELIIVDIAEAAITHCRERFAADEHVRAYVNDGCSLAMADRGSVDLAFSFDSLVHAEADVIGGYLGELARVLSVDGVAFLHHSNLGSYDPGSYDPHNVHWRAPSVSAERVARAAGTLGLSAISQEKVAWGDMRILNDCFSVIARAGSRWDRANVVVENPRFGADEIAISKLRSTQYPPSRRDVRFGSRTPGGAADPRKASAEALRLLSNGETALARATLQRQLRASVDPDVLNDLAVLANHCGDREIAVDLLRALVRLHPDDAAAAENLALLGSLVPGTGKV